MSEQHRPELEIEAEKRELHFFWLVDYSYSMGGDRIATVNQCIRETLPEIENIASSNPECEMYMRAIKFSTGADWHVGPRPESIGNFIWPDLSVAGSTSTATAIQMLCDQLEKDKMPRRGLPPICLLLSDGYCTESDDEYSRAIERLNMSPWGRKAVRLAIAIGGQEEEYDEAALLKFVNHPEVGLLKAHTAAQLVNHIRWASTSTTRTVSSGASSSDHGSFFSEPPPDNDDYDKDELF